MRMIIYGAGAIGGTLGSRLHLAGFDVLLIARGAHA
ncbi:MAG: ketopantoate reductase family protein, partial [Gammaproteobacteria bacterium]|nr:ketopantoate reductase family protein [Gammaproteobacteria bacterium]